MTVAEGGGRRAVGRKFQEVYLPALKANFMLWPAVQILNFRVVPLQFQIVSSVGTTFTYGLLTLFPAFCFICWNSLDCVPLFEQLV